MNMPENNEHAMDGFTQERDAPMCAVHPIATMSVPRNAHIETKREDHNCFAILSMGLQGIRMICFASLNLLDDGRSNAGSGSQANVRFPPHSPDGGGLGGFGEHSRQHISIGRQISNMKSFSKTSKVNMS
jgi:hypothetical protein